MLARMPLEANRPRRRLGVSSLLFLSFFALGALLRLLLCWANRPYNAFDDHFEPILMTMKAGVIPARDACFQCFQPPVFYWISARIGEAALQAGLPLPSVIKLLQFVGCGAGILTVAVCYLILRNFRCPILRSWPRSGPSASCLATSTCRRCTPTTPSRICSWRFRCT